MKQNYKLSLKIPEGINCNVSGNILQCSKGGTSLERSFGAHSLSLQVKDGEIIITCFKSNKKGVANVNSYVAHVKNIFQGLSERFVYELEICNVHFPMTVKVDKNNLTVSNFLGEKVPRNAKILDGVEVKVDGSKITVSSADLEKAGQTAANIEKSATVTKKDRRIFQDGIFITKKPGVEI